VNIYKYPELFTKQYLNATQLECYISCWIYCFYSKKNII